MAKPRHTATALLAAVFVLLAAGCGNNPPDSPADGPGPADTATPITVFTPDTAAGGGAAAVSRSEPDGCWDAGSLIAEGWDPLAARRAENDARTFPNYPALADADPCDFDTFEALEAALQQAQAIKEAPAKAAAEQAARPGPEPPPDTASAPGAGVPSTKPAAETGEPSEVFAEEGELGTVTVTIPPGQPPEPDPGPAPGPEARDCADGGDDNECERLGGLVQDCLADGKTEAECGIVGAGDNPPPTGTIVDYGSNEHEAGGHPPPLAALPPASGTVHGVLEDLADPGADGPWGDARMTVPLSVEAGDEFLGDEYGGERLRGRVTRPPRRYGDGPGDWTVYMCWTLTTEEAGYDAFREDDGRFRLNTWSGFSVPDNPCPSEPQ